MAEPKNFFQIVQNSKVESLISGTLGGILRLTTWCISEFSFYFRSACIDPEWQPGQAKPYHTKPRHFRPIFRPFWPYNGLKTPKNQRDWFEGAWPLKVHLCRIYFLLALLLGKFNRFRNASDYMWKGLNNYFGGGHRTLIVLWLHFTLFPLPPPSMTAERMISAPTPPLDIARANHLE